MCGGLQNISEMGCLFIDSNPFNSQPLCTVDHHIVHNDSLALLPIFDVESD